MAVWPYLVQETPHTATFSNVTDEREERKEHIIQRSVLRLDFLMTVKSLAQKGFHVHESDHLPRQGNAGILLHSLEVSRGAELGADLPLMVRSGQNSGYRM